MSQTEGIAQRPTRELPWQHLLNLSVYWLGINVIWGGLGTVVFQQRTQAMFGRADGPFYAALLEAVPLVLAVIIQPTVAVISDYTVSRWGRRKPYIVIGTLLDVVFLWGIASSHEYVSLLVFVVLLQCSSNFAQGPFQGYVPDLVPARQVGLASGLMGVMITLGLIAGVAIAGIGSSVLPAHITLGDQVGIAAEAYRQAFFWPTLGLAVIELVTMIPLVLFVDEGRAGPSRGGRSWLQIALSAWGTDILRERSYIWLLVSRFLFLMAAGVLIFLGVYYLERTLGYAPNEVAQPLLLVSAVLASATLLSTVPAARLSDRIGRKRTIYISIGLSMIGMTGVAGAADLPTLLVAVVPVGMGAGSFLAVDWALMTDIIPKATTGRYMGISNVATALSGPAGRLTMGLLLAGLVLFGLPPELRGMPVPPAEQSAFYALAPRLAILSTLVLFAASAWALRHVVETRRED